MAKIDRVEDLPDWFDLEKYKGCESFGAAEWLEQLERRRDLLALHPTRVGTPTACDTAAWEDFTLTFWKIAVREPAEEVRAAPLNSPSKGKVSKWLADRCNQPIKGVCAYDLMWQSTRDLDAERNGKAAQGTSQRWDAISPSGGSLSSFVSWANVPLTINYHDGSPERPILQIDLGASDAILKTAFAAWLKEARAGSARRAKPLYDRWSRYGLLPYLDLLIWSMETGIRIPDRVMSAAISSYDAGEANLRKTVAPLATELLRDLSELRAFSAVEAAAGSHISSETLDD